MARWAVFMLAVLALVTACSGGDASVRGVVVAVAGDITMVESFVLRLPDGTDQTIVPAPGVSFTDGAAIGHLRDHLRSGQPIVVVYEILDDGTWVAYRVDDG